jgi:SAM-dependent methyltransferase
VNGLGLLPLLRCPATGSPLALAGGSLSTPDGARVYPIVDGVPILIARERSLFDPADYGQTPRASLRGRVRRLPKQLALGLLALLPTIGRNLVGRENVQRLLALLRAGAAPGTPVRVLVVGGGKLGVGMEALLSAPDIELVQTDVALTPSIAIVCDGHDLPFADGVFDAVVCQAVLEHVLDPQRVAAEIWRVLAPTGFVYSEVPFMQQVHAGAFDFTRFTHLGHRRLWRFFDEIASGADSGPGMALAWGILYFVRSLTPRRLWPLTRRAAVLSVFWLKYLDGWLVRRPEALDAASGTFFLGRRRETAVDDREIVGGYRGGSG